MSASTLDRLRTITHDAGALAGDVVTDVSGAAFDALASVDTDRIAALPGAVVGGLGASSTLTRRFSLRRIMLGVGVIVAAGFVAALVVRSRRSEDAPVESGLDARRDVRMAG
jgi:hypothetical protein